MFLFHHFVRFTIEGSLQSRVAYIIFLYLIESQRWRSAFPWLRFVWPNPLFTCYICVFNQGSMAARDFAETDRNCLWRNSQLQFHAIAGMPMFHRSLDTMNRIENSVYHVLW